MTTPIVLTEAASTYIKKKVEQEKGMGFRMSVKKTGCSGFSYHPSIVSEVNEKDIRVETEKGLTLFIDAGWLHLLQGVQVDYIEEDKSGLKQKRLVFTNPKEASRCGCGESFHIE
jgi:iron-sulfur cluster assembly protein